MKKKKIIYLSIIILLIIIDQVSKYLVTKFYDIGQYTIIIKNFLKFYYIRNIGASFGILGGKTILIIFISLLIMFYIIYEVIKNKNKRILIVSSILIISGAIGNLIDRVFRGYVIDFISFTLFGKEMAIFNIADILITFGVIVYIYYLIMESKNEKNRSK